MSATSSRLGSPDLSIACLYLLMATGEAHELFLSTGLGAEAVASPPRPQALPLPESLWDEGTDPNDLASQRWGVIAPAGATGDRLLALIEPLIEHRRRQQSGAPVPIYRVGAKVRTLADGARWRKRYFDRGTDLRANLPRYQLIVGDLADVPLAVQQVLATDGFVGRIAFDDDAGYTAYVDKVLRWENQGPAGPRGDAIVYTVRDGTRATENAYEGLIVPGVDLLRRHSAIGNVVARDLVPAGGANAAEFFEVARALRPPSVMFTLSHGLGPPAAGWRSEAQQRQLQGAMCFAQGEHIAGRDLVTGPFLPGGIWLMFACFGAGTPLTSAYHHWLETLRAVGHVGRDIDRVLAALPGPQGQPFVSAVPKAVLANPDGPVAFLGHVDLSWSYSFQSLDDRVMNRPAHFMEILRAALLRYRVGVGAHALARFLAQVHTELAGLYDRSAPQSVVAVSDRALTARLGHLWMLRQDLAGYVLLGDPAVRLALGPHSADTAVSAGAAGAGAAAVADTAAVDTGIADTAAADLATADLATADLATADSGAADAAAANAAAAPPLAPDSAAVGAIGKPEPLALTPDALDKAIGMVLSGKFTDRAAAKEYDLDVSLLRDLVDAYRAGGREAVLRRWHLPPR